MDINNQTEKASKPVKSFMTAGPTLHYSHENVQRCWLAAVLVFGLTCIFWSKILTGSFLGFNFQTLMNPKLWHLGRFTTTGVSIFEYPWQILVLSLLMGMIMIMPTLISQLLSFSYSLPLILGVLFLADLPGFALSLFISCVAAACRPFRFRSRFIALVLCTAPQLIYWGYFGGVRGVEPIKWGFSFAPWIGAWLIGLAVAGAALAVGHYTRYRPSLVWVANSIVLALAFTVFQTKIGVDELDYQLYIAKNNPEQVKEFLDFNIAEVLDKTITKPSSRVKRYFQSSFYPIDNTLLRAELKNKIQIELNRGRWPSWFEVPDALNYQAKKAWLLSRYDLFIKQRSTSRRMPVVLYYKALLYECTPDTKLLGQKEILHFYNDYPFEDTQAIWFWLYNEFGNSPESIEARWRIAKNWAGQGKFELAEKILVDAQNMAEARMQQLEKEQMQITDAPLNLFYPPADSVITSFNLEGLQRRLNQLSNLISSENKTDDPASAARLQTFVMLNPHSEDYGQELDKLLDKMKENDPLRDNVLLAQIRLIQDEQLQAEKLDLLHKKYQNTDGGMQSLYELALLKIHFWRQQSDSNTEQKKQLLTDARVILADYVGLYPNSICTEQVKKNLETLPAVEK